MSIDILHEKVRKLKNPSMIDFGIKKDSIPDHILAQEPDFCAAYVRFCRELLAELKGIVPAVRFSMGDFALLGAEGITQLKNLLNEANELGFYVALDAPEIHSPWAADRVAQTVFGEDAFSCDALVISPYIGTDAIKPFLPYCKNGKDLFVMVRSPNKSAADLQDLFTGSRLVHNAAADLVNRMGENITGRCAYSRVGAVVSAGAANSVKSLRSGYLGMYLLVDGVDYPSGNFKNCSHAFDRFGYGAVVCAGPSVTAAWREGEGDGKDYLVAAVQAAERMKKNICRYVTIL